MTGSAAIARDRDQPGRAIGCCEVDLDWGDGALVGQLLQLGRRVARPRDDMGPRGGKAPRDRQADALARTSHDYALAAQPEFHDRPLFLDPPTVGAARGAGLRSK
jgi:hypothetical protein